MTGMAAKLVMDSLKRVACTAVDSSSEKLNELSSFIWHHPELAFTEHKAHDYLTEFLGNEGFTVTPHHILDTAFRAEFGDDNGPCVGLMCEYDALPGIGHACGHNLISEAAVGAAIGIKAALQEAKTQGKSLGKVVLLGTPAEESGGGKILLLEEGGMAGMDVAMMVHPKLSEHPSPESLCVVGCVVRYEGKASHAAAFPWEGVNALDAAVMAYNNVSVLRQQMKPKWRVHGVITNGGAKPNIIPESSELAWQVRTPTRKELVVFQQKIEACFQAAATATGCKVHIKWDSTPYYNLIHNKILSELYADNLRLAGFAEPFDKEGKFASTDMGNVSYQIPSIHPVFRIGPVVNHTREFAELAGEAVCQAPTLQRAKSMAMSGVDVLTNPACLQEIKRQFSQDMQEEGS